MATRHASALKANRQTVKRQAHNYALRSRLKTALKAIRTAIADGETDKATSLVDETVSVIDKMAAKGLIHDNAAGRHKSRLAKQLSARIAAGSAG